MIFNRLAIFIVRYYKIIIPLWLISLVLSYPLIIKAQSEVSLQQGSTSDIGLESQIAQRLIDKEFTRGSSQSSLFLVIKDDNVTSNSVIDFVNEFTSQISINKPSNLLSVGSAIKSVGELVDSLNSTEQRIKNGTDLLIRLFYASPSIFLSLWIKNYSSNINNIYDAEQLAIKTIEAEVNNKTESSIITLYLSSFTNSFASRIGSMRNSSLFDIAQASINDSSKKIIDSFIPPSQKDFAISIVNYFNITDFSDSRRIEEFVIDRVKSLTLFSPEMARAVYENTGQRDNLVLSIIRNPDRYNIPPIYRSSVTGYISPDRELMLVTLSFNNISSSDVSYVRSLVNDIAQRFGLDGRVMVTGQQALQSDIIAAEVHDNDSILPLTIILLIVATGIFFRSILTPFISLGIISIALGLAQTAIFFVSLYIARVDVTVPTILITVLIGVGTDYTVFLLARYREERVRGRENKQAIVNSVTWAGESIATSGATVIISFLSLALQPVTFLKGLGSVVGMGVLIALLASLTLVPSIIMLTSERIFYPNSGSRFKLYSSRVREIIDKRKGYFSKSGRFALRHAKPILIISIIITIPSIYLWYNLQPSYDFLSAAPPNLESVVAFNDMSAKFGAGTLFPTYVVMEFSEPIWNGTSYNIEELRIIDEVSNITLAHNGIDSVTGPTRPGGARIDFYNIGNDPRSRQIVSNINKMIGSDTRYALLKISMQESPYQARSMQITKQLRQEYHSIAENDKLLIASYVGGASGSILDTSNTVNDEFARIITYVTIAVAIVLLFVLGSLFLPIFAIVSIVMSIAWTIAATSLVFRALYNFPILYITPLTLFVLLLGLGMDYNIFILTRIREEAEKGKGLEEAILVAIENTGGIITAAAIILAGSLGALMISSSLLLKEFGFAFSFSILIDAMVMRTYIVPAVMSLIGKWNWYAPGRLQRVRIEDGK